MYHLLKIKTCDIFFVETSNLSMLVMPSKQLTFVESRIFKTQYFSQMKTVIPAFSS